MIVYLILNTIQGLICGTFGIIFAIIVTSFFIPEMLQKGSIDLLVGTTIVEVGVHVPEATVMVIEHPECFGLAQLHQLRGRVGRGTEEGHCFLMLSDNLPERVLSRIKCLADNQDGFKIAQQDFELRGYGELTGTRQTGIGELDDVEHVTDPVFGLQIPKTCPNVPDETMLPWLGWADKAEYDKAAKKLAHMFTDAFKKYEGHVNEAVLAAARPGIC